MVVLENGLLLDGVLYAVLDLIRRLFRFEVHQTSGVLSVFEDMNDGVGRPFALIVIFEAAKSTLLAVQGDRKLPRMKALQAEQERLTEEQQRLYDKRAKLKKEAKQIDTKVRC